MFTSRKVRRLECQVQSLTIDNEELAGASKSLKNQRDALMGENETLRTQIKEMRNEYNDALEAKETERQELCNKLGELQEKAKKDAATIAHQSDTIRRILNENAFLIKTNANLSGKFVPNRGLKRIYGKWGKSEDKK